MSPFIDQLWALGSSACHALSRMLKSGAYALSKTRLAGSPATRSSALPADVKFRAERKLGRRAEALTPQRLRSVFIAFGGPPRAMVTPARSRLGRVGIDFEELTEPRALASDNEGAHFSTLLECRWF
jgi:hypothetical protein